MPFGAFVLRVRAVPFSIMGFIISFFKWVYDGLLRFGTWLVGVPALVVSSFAGLYSSYQQVHSLFTSGNSAANQIIDSATQPVNDLVSLLSGAPDIIKLAVYSLSLDIAFDSILAILGLFVALLVAVVSFFFVAVPLFVVQLYVVKSTAWVLSFIPSISAIMGPINALSSLNIMPSFRAALKDGKYNPFLSS